RDGRDLGPDPALVGLLAAVRRPQIPRVLPLIVIHRRGGDKPMDLPKFLQIEPVGQCNLRCQMCPIQFRQDGPPYGPLAFMDFGTFTRLVDDLPSLQELHLQGLGEPMMHPRFFDMVAYAASRGVRVSTNTNMTLLNPAR